MKVFIGDSVSWEINEEALKEYFMAYGEMMDVVAKAQHKEEMAMLARERARAEFQD